MEAYPKIRNLILASASPRRRELLASLGIEFTVKVPEIDETPREDEPPVRFAERLASEKAEAVECGSDTTVVAADTIVVLDRTILGKPAHEHEAFDMLSRLSGRRHEVITAVCVKHDDHIVVFSVSTEVVFRSLKTDEISAYIASGCPLDKAGAYAIQGGAAHMVRAINGSYTNVVGLPLCELHETLASL
jgi:septum formation protein